MALAHTGVKQLSESWRSLYWGSIPLLAIIAYAPALGIGFLADDFVLLREAQTRDLGLDDLLPNPDWLFYRPAATLLIWELGWQVWGANPVPYHVQGLLIHAGTSLALGLWLVEATARRGLGWLAGALFAVFPLHLEAVGWLAAQWDALAALFGLLSLWLFTRFWITATGQSKIQNPKSKMRWLYLLSLILYGLAIFTKESLLAFWPLLGISAWLTTEEGRRMKDEGRKYKFHPSSFILLPSALLPFAGLMALNLGLRFGTWGNLGGYSTIPESGVRTDYVDFFWDAAGSHLHLLLSPINATVMGGTIAQVVFALSSLGLLLGLVFYGRGLPRVLLVAGAWIVLALVPVLNLPIHADDLRQNRFLYLPAAGYAVAVAVLLYLMVGSAGRWRPLAISSVSVLVLLGVIASWVQLAPWQTASVEVERLDRELRRLIPPQPRPQGMVWYAEDVPYNYKGAQMLELGLTRSFVSSEDIPFVKVVPNAADAPLTVEESDVFALRFDYDKKLQQFGVRYAAGLTGGGPPPSPTQAGDNLLVWDFRDCAGDVVASWRVIQARSQCEAGAGLAVRPIGDDTRMLGPDISLAPIESQARFVRLRVSALYPAGIPPGSNPHVNEWFWQGKDEEWSAERSRRMVIKDDGKAHVYWTFVPASEVGGGISRLRFDPANSIIPTTVQWIALDLVK